MFQNNFGYIYIIKNYFDDKIKIGSTFSYEKRFYQYKTYSPFGWKYISVYEIIDDISHNYEESINCYLIDDIIQREFSHYLTKKCYEECKEGGTEWYCNKNNLIDKIDLFLSTSFNINKLDDIHLDYKNFSIFQKWSSISKYVLYSYLNNFIMTELEYKEIKKAREYQEEYIKECYEEIENESRCLLIAPTGAGKTFMFYAIARKLLKLKRKESNNKKATIIIAIISPRLSINEQTVNVKNRSLLSTNTNYIKINGTDYKESCLKYNEEIKDNNTNFIISSTYQSSAKLKEFLITNNIKVDLMIFDECHFIQSWENQDSRQIEARNFIMNDLKYIEKRLFCSATPYQEQRDNYDKYGLEIEKTNISKLIKSGYLCPIKTIIKDYEEQCNLPELIIKEVIEKKKQKTIVFCNTQNNCCKLYDYFITQLKRHNIKPYLYISNKTVIGEDFEDEDTLKEFEKDEEISIIITCKKISMGYDYPRIDMVVFADSKCQKIDIAQCIGRGLRTIICNPNKVCHVLLPVNEKELSKAKYETIRGFFEYMREECEYEILSSKSWEPKPLPKPLPIPGPPIIDKDDYGLQIECDFKDNSLKTKILSMYSIDKTPQNYTLSTQLEKIKSNNILSYSEYEVFYKKSKEAGLYTVDELKAEKRFYWKLVDSNQKYYKNQKQCEKEIKKLDKTFKLNDTNIAKFIGYNKRNPKIPPMPLKEYYGIYCRNMKECFSR